MPGFRAIYASNGPSAISYEHHLPPFAPVIDDDKSTRRVRTVRPIDDDKLRRLVGLGFVIQEDHRRKWRKTDHILVINIDDKDVQRCKP